MTATRPNRVPSEQKIDLRGKLLDYAETRILGWANFAGESRRGYSGD
jgi:hypothetical protein